MLLTVEWNPRALLVTLAVVAGAIGWHFTSRQEATSQAEEPTSATNHLVASLPDRLPTGEVTPVARSLGAIAGYDYIDGDAALRALVFEEGPGWYKVVYYLGDGAGYARVDGTNNPTGFDAPRMVGSPPVLAFRSQDMNVDFAFRLRDGRMELEALGGATLGPAVPVEDPALPGLTAHPVTP